MTNTKDEKLLGQAHQAVEIVGKDTEQLLSTTPTQTSQDGLLETGV